MLSGIARKITEKFWSYSNGIAFTGRHAIRAYRTASLLVSLFYFVVFSVAMQSFSSFSQMPEWHLLLSSKEMFIPVWPVAWLNDNNWQIGVSTIMIGFLLSSVMALVYWNRWRVTRVLVFIFFFQYLALISSFGKIDHYLHLVLISSGFFIFLPTKGSIKTTKVEVFLKIFWSVQLFILLTYSVSGVFKIFGIFDQWFRGFSSALSPDGLGQNIAKTTFASGYESFLGKFIMDNPSWLFAVFLIGGYLIELFSAFIAFRPRLHRLWGLLLILMHASILLTVGPDFYYQVILVGLFIFFSPFCFQSRSAHNSQ